MNAWWWSLLKMNETWANAPSLRRVHEFGKILIWLIFENNDASDDF